MGAIFRPETFNGAVTAAVLMRLNFNHFLEIPSLEVENDQI